MTKTMTEILIETILYYKENPRSTMGSMCYYYRPSDGAMCAVGRCCENPKSLPNSTYESLRSDYKDDGFLKPEYRGHPNEFWTALQRLHDRPEFWPDGDHGSYCYPLSQAGVAYVELMIIAFDLDWCKVDVETGCTA